jgi:hypothetical protein
MQPETGGLTFAVTDRVKRKKSVTNPGTHPAAATDIRYGASRFGAALGTLQHV